jgi:hypothetical protein
MTTKTEMTLENVCFKHDLREASEKAIEVGNKKYGANHKGEFECFYWVDKGKFFGHYDNFKRRKLIAPSDYLLLLSAPESQAHLLTEKDLIVGNRFECKEELILEPNKTPFKKGEFYTGNFIGRRLLEYDTDKENVERILNRHFKLVSQPPVMEGKEENGMKNIPKTLFLIMGDEAYEETDFNNLEHEFVCWAQKRTDQTDIEYILKSESDKSISSLQSEVEQLKGALQELVDIQNGPPLEQHKNEWREIMDKCYSILSK